MNAYHFPAIRQEWLTIKHSIWKILAEGWEVLIARNREERIIELIDLIHCCESYLRSLGVSENELAQRIREVEAKNEYRGYYQ